MAKQDAKYRVIERPETGQIRLIDEQGEQVGIIDISEALEIAKSKELDLVEVSPNAEPPTCRLMNFGRHKYNLRKKQQKGSKKTVRKRKEVKLRPKTEEHDFQVKLKRAKKFIEEGHKALVTLIFRGREQKRPEQGFELLNRFSNELAEVAKLEREPSREAGNRIGMVLVSNKR